MAGRFFRRGTSKAHFVPAVADLGAPTRVEIDAGQDLSEEVADISGWQLQNSPIPTPNLADRFTASIEGEDTVGDSSITFYDLDNATVIRDALAKGTEGFIVFFPYGDIATKRCEVFPIRTTHVSDEKSMGNDPARFMVGFVVTDEPDLEAVIPAAA